VILSRSIFAIVSVWTMSAVRPTVLL